MIKPMKNFFGGLFTDLKLKLTDPKTGLGNTISNYFKSDSTIGGKVLGWVKEKIKKVYYRAEQALFC